MVLHHFPGDDSISFSFSYTDQTDSNLRDSTSASLAVFHPEEKTERMVFLPVVQFPVEGPG